MPGKKVGLTILMLSQCALLAVRVFFQSSLPAGFAPYAGEFQTASSATVAAQSSIFSFSKPVMPACREARFFSYKTFASEVWEVESAEVDVVSSVLAASLQEKKTDSTSEKNIIFFMVVLV